MFGEKNIYGQSSVKVDQKNRIILPSFTYAEANDELLIIDNGEYLSLYNESYINNFIEEYEKEYKDASISKKIEIEKEFLKIYSMILKKVKCDSQRRISLSKIDLQTDELICKGAKKYLILERKKSLK